MNLFNLGALGAGGNLGTAMGLSPMASTGLGAPGDMGSALGFASPDAFSGLGPQGSSGVFSGAGGGMNPMAALGLVKGASDLGGALGGPMIQPPSFLSAPHQQAATLLAPGPQALGHALLTGGR